MTTGFVSRVLGKVKIAELWFNSSKGIWDSVSGLQMSPLLTASVTLTSAQVLALNTTPQNIIPAPAAGQLILVEDVAYVGTGAYTQADGAGLVYHGTTTAADGSYKNASDPFINGTAYSYGLGGIAAHAATNQSVGSILGLGVDVASITTNPTVGTTPVTVVVTYKVLTT